MADHICRSLYEDDEADEIDTLRARITELESAIAKSASREAALVEKLKVAETALTDLSSVDGFGCCDSGYSAAHVARAALAKIKEAS